MSVAAPANGTCVEGRVLILAPTANDARLTAGLLRNAGAPAEVCEGIPELCRKVEEGCSALLVAEEVLEGNTIAQLIETLARQPAWSDLPIVIITSGGEVSQMRLQRLGVFGPGGNVTLLERPFRPATLVSAVEAALRARSRQHEARDLLEKLQASEERLLGILDSLSDAFVAIDRDWRITYMNPSYVKLVSPLFDAEEELLGRILWEKFPDIADMEVGRFYKQAMEERKPGTFELFYEPLQAWLGVRVSPSAAGLSLYIQDISERKRREAEVEDLTRRIEAQAKLFDATLSNIADLAYSFDREGRVTYANKALLELWGKKLPDVLGKNLFDLKYPPDLAEKLHGQLMEVVATGKPVRGETLLKSAAGEEDIHEYIYNPVFDEKGRVGAVVGTTRLVTAHRRAEGAMRQLAAIVESSDDAIISKNLDGIIMSWNAGARRLFGYEAEEVIGRSLTILIPEDRLDEEVEILSRICRGEPIEHYETLRLHKDGSQIMVSITVSPIRDHDGKIVGASKIARDITDQKRTERALKEAKEAAEEASRSKDHFLAVLSHELRTPLTPVLMMASALEMDPTIPSKLRAEMAMIRRNVELETKLIDDLLDLSRITTGKLALHIRALDINEAIRQVCAICEPQIQENGVRLETDIDEKASHVRADPARLQQVLWNLLKNAAKFTPEGGNIRVSTRDDAEGRVWIMVRDTGRGIDPQMLPKIFDAFEQGDAGVTRQFGGLGLGLAITKALVELHGGVIQAESEGLGRGSTFAIGLPAAAAEVPPKTGEAVEKGPTEALRILVVEDHVDTATMLARLLNATGYEVAAANTAGEALEMAARQRFDIVISDIGLPDLTGYELMRKLCARQKIKGVAMSGYGMEEDIRRSLEAGFSEHLVKPVTLSSLEQAVRRISLG